MTLIERARSLRPVTWVGLVGVVLLPVLIGALLVSALDNPAERLGNMKAAIVNNDAPVTVNGQTVPLGRQFAAGLVKGSDSMPSNIDWTISNTDDAATGLANGTYTAVITIPQNFSAAATSTAGSSPEKATIQVETAKDAKVVDAAITGQLSQAAASVLGQQLTENYLQNVLVGFGTLHDKLSDAASGAHQLATGATDANTGATTLSDGLQQLTAGIGQLSTGARGVASGAQGLVSGAGTLSSGLSDAAKGMPALTAAAQASASYASSAASQTQHVASALGDVLAQHCGGSTMLDPTMCQDLAGIVGSPSNPATNTAAGAATAAGSANGYATATSTGVQNLSGGIAQSAAGAAQLQGGATQLASGASALVGGVSSTQSGAAQLSSGAQSLSSGVSQLSSGADSLAQGLDQAVAGVPAQTKDSATALAKVVANPVTIDGTSSNLFGAAAIPLLATLVLWFGSLGSFVLLQASSRRALSSRLPSIVLALRSFLPGAIIGAVQGALMAVVVQVAANYPGSTFGAFVGLAVLGGVGFAAVNQALVALFGGTGRLLSAVVGALAVAAGVVSTAPAIFGDLSSVLPTGPLYTAMLGAVTGAGGAGGAVVGLIVWLLLGIIASTLATARRRTVSTRALSAGIITS